MEKRVIEISWHTIYRILAVFILVVFLYLIRDILAILLFAVVIASAIDPLAVWLEKRGLSRVLTVLMVYIFLFTIVGSVIYLLIPPLLSEVRELAVSLPHYLEKVNVYFGIAQPAENAGQTLAGTLKDFLLKLEGNLGDIAANTFRTAINIFGGVTSIVLVVVISFYLSMRDKGIDDFLRAIIPAEHEDYVMEIWERSKRKIGRWVQGQLLLGFIVGVAVYVGLALLGVKYALILGIVAGIAELVPIVGVMISGTIAIVLSAAQDPFLGVMALLLFVIIQQFENHVIVPLVMRRIMGLNPVIVVLSLVIGLQLGGILGMLLGIPAAAVAVEFWSDFEKKKPVP